MTIFHNDIASGRISTPDGDQAGDVVVQFGSYTFPVAAASGDIIEIGVLPARHAIVNARIVANGITVGNVGILSGTSSASVGADVDETGVARTVGTSFVTGGLVNDAAYGIAAVNYDRGIGVVLGAAVAANAGPLLLVISYAQ